MYYLFRTTIANKKKFYTKLCAQLVNTVRVQYFFTPCMACFSLLVYKYCRRNNTKSASQEKTYDWSSFSESRPPMGNGKVHGYYKKGKVDFTCYCDAIVSIEYRVVNFMFFL